MPDAKSGGPKYRLTADHYIGDQLLLSGTEIGEGTPFPYLSPDGKSVPPSQFMEPLNPAAEQEVKNLGQRNRNPVDSIPIKGAQ